ncbi:MAG: ABC transporter permease [Candidatus Velamenicoccus archaeovorus]
MSTVVTQRTERRLSEPAPVNPPRRRWTRFILPTFTFLMILYLTSPVFLMILYGFNRIPGDRQTPRFWGFTLQWYKELFAIPGLTEALKNSLIIAPTAAIVATVFGTFLGLAIGRYVFRGKGVVDFFIFLAIAVPEIVLGSSLLAMFVQAKAPLGFGTILLSHIGFDTPFVAVTVQARVAGMDRSLEDAAQDLFANPATTFFRVTLPQIMPGIFAGFLLAFVLSLDDFVITQFVSGQTQTFPIWVFGATRIGLPPQVNVMGTLLFAAGLVVAIANGLAQRRRR